MQDFAFLKIASGRYLCGLGPFRESAECAEHPAAFYRNRFDLSDPRPWKIPHSYFETDDLRDLLGKERDQSLPEIIWSKIDDRKVREIFEEILGEITSGRLQKSVPVLTERGKLNHGDPANLLHALRGHSEETWGYGYRSANRGMLGRSPELLFSLNANLLHTMALAGTAPQYEAGAFPNDSKEISEHEVVADYIEEKLTPLGKVERENRGLLHLGPIVHFLTRLQVSIAQNPVPKIEELIRLLHPTPALGAHPRGTGALEKLIEYRKRLHAPEEFGAPFGLRYQDRFLSVVSIRNVSWQGNNCYLSSGVGIVDGSRFDREWRELGLKRNSVKALLGI